ITGNEVSDFFAGMFPGIAFFLDKVDGAHAMATGNDARLTSHWNSRQRTDHPQALHFYCRCGVCNTC
ncbi:MAG: hypothetical protein WBR26_15960, partial [Candidatus Acidiferrum sp.]